MAEGRKTCSYKCSGIFRRTEKGRLAYDQRADGLPWKRIAVNLNYGREQTAWRAARRTAKRDDLPWPPVSRQSDTEV